MGHVAENLARIHELIASSAMKAGRDASAIKLIAVSKGQPAAAIREAYEAGQRDFGENYVQELVAKASELGSTGGLVFHAIGSLQRNKVKDVVRIARVIHTVDRFELAIEIDKRAVDPIDVLLEVNVAREPQKGGCDPEAAEELAERVTSLAKTRLVGLMTVPPLDAEPGANRPHFTTLAALRDRIAARFPSVRELSMGMSQDFEDAIAEGATMVRVGTAIFGARAPKPRS